MIVRRFLLWARTAAPGQRAEALGALARAYLYSELSAEDRWEAETAMTALLDDPSPLVRRALAEVLANAGDAPRHIVIALANDQSDVSTLVLARSPVLADEDLVECAALGDELIQTAIALRPHVSIAVAAALAEIAGAGALAALAGNCGAQIARSSLARMIERHGGDGRVREALLARADLPLDVRHAIAAALAQSLSAFVTGCGWLSRERTDRAVREAGERATVVLADGAPVQDVGRLVVHLRRSGQLTPALILRALLSQSLAFVEAALADLTGLPPARVAGLLHDRRGAGFAALYARSGLPGSLKPAFDAAVAALREAPLGDGAGAGLSRRMIERALSACAVLPPAEAGKLLALLRRYEAEAAREEARELSEALTDEAALAAVLEHQPYALLAAAPAPLLIARAA